MPKTRGQGEGAVFPETRPGRTGWRGTVDLGRSDTTGRRVRKEVSGRTRAEVLRKIAAAKADAARGITANEKQTVAGFLKEWLDSPEVTKLSASSRAQYAYIVEGYLIPEVGHQRLSKLTPQHVEAMLNRMGQPEYANSRPAKGVGRPRSGDGCLSPRTRQLTRSVLRRALSRAERFGDVPRNVAALASAPKSDRSGSPKPLTLEEAGKLISVARDDERYGPIILLAIATGMRQSELIGLHWADVDLDARSLSITGSITRFGPSTTKTKSGLRTIPIGELAIDALRMQRRVQAEARLAARHVDVDGQILDHWHDTGLVFTTSIGTSEGHRNVTRGYHAACLRAGLSAQPFHGSRHTTATLMLAAGVPMSTISAQLGHAGLAITADIYAEVGQALKREAVEALDRALGL